MACAWHGMNRANCALLWANTKLSSFDFAQRGTLLPMRSATPRVAYFPDTFYEINGVSHTSRQFQAFAERKGLPFFCLHPGQKDSVLREQQQGGLTTLDIPRDSFLSFRLEKDLTFDPAFLRHKE